ncbi:hypothetical protein SLS54_008853 [Diplodia seriata]
MEHLLLNGESIAPLSIPYMGSKFDGGDFFTFPDRKGWNVSSWEYADPETNGFDLNDKSVREMASFLQAWLFFGILTAFFGDECSPDDFIRTDDAGNKFITTKMLDNYLATWSRKIRDPANVDDLEKQEDRLQSYLMKARKVNSTLNFVLFYEKEPSDSEPLRQTLFAQTILLEVLFGVTADVFEVQPFNEHLFHDTYLRNHLMRSGWCVTTLEYMQSKLPLQVQAYALTVGSTRTRLDHGECSQYDPAGCKRNQMGPDFKQKHATPDCKCAQIAVPTDKLVGILQQDRIPVVTMKRPESSLLPMELLLDGLDLDHPEFEIYSPYFAFSHVWSDGLGNENDNALYQCQLERLDSMLQSLEGDRVTIARHGFDTTARELGTVAFWLDTLCIPVQKEHKAFRSFSIQNMHKIYSKAAGTVVVDPDIQTVSADAKPAQVLTRVLCSTWRSRMWTYEEAALNPYVFLPAESSCFSFQSEDQLSELPSCAPPSLVERQLLRACWERYCDLVWDNLASFCIAKKPAKSFVRMVTAASNRNTTKPGDETICFATFLGLDTAQLVQTPVEDRMPLLLSLLPAVPSEILFASGPRLEQKGYRWAPKSFLSPFGLHEYLQVTMPRDYSPEGNPSNGRIPIPQPFIHPQNLGLGVFLSGIQFQRKPCVTTPLLFTIETQSRTTHVVEAVDTGSEVPWMLSESNPGIETFAILLTDISQCSVGLLVKVTGETADGKMLCRWSSVVEMTSNEDADEPWIGSAKKSCFQGAFAAFQWWLVD